MLVGTLCRSPRNPTERYLPADQNSLRIELTWRLICTMANIKAESSVDSFTLSSNSNIPSQPNNPLSRKLNKILETRLDNDKEMLEALKALSVFFTENSLRTRRNLRGDIERRSLTINEEFVRIFKEVKEELESVHEDVQAMSTCCEEMTNRLKAAKEQTQDLIVKTNKLQGENHRLEVRAQVAQAFLAKFQLSNEEMATLRGARDAPVTEDFFNVLSRVKHIHEDVKILLRTNQQTAG
ncbi:Golgi transport complex subunit 6 [Ilyodon furcidens]|uniref:Conserved oligomeric Golgi complex subunit 6 n=1 Tax=Ilyodon furcidens TaxID=33524 RepID=A0ABV0UPN3_9TELE